MHENRSIWTWLTLGTLIALLGGGLFAATSDAITSEDNSAQTNQYIAPIAGVDIRGTVVDDASLCNATDTPAAAFTDGPLPAIVNGSWDLNAAEPTISSDVVCLWNAGTDDGTVLADVSQSASIEIGACEADEGSAGDPTCADGEAGELRAGFGPETSVACEFGPDFTLTLAVGAYCDYRYDAVPVFLDASGSPTSDPTLAQTDAVTYDLTWTIEQKVCQDVGADTPGTAEEVAVANNFADREICDDDWFLATGLTPGAQYEVFLFFLQADIDLDLYVSETDGTSLGGSSSTTDNEYVLFTAPASGSVLIRADVFAGGPAPYDLILESV